MSMYSYEGELVSELRKALGNRKITRTWIQQWVLGNYENIAREGETFVYIPSFNVSVALKQPARKERKN